MVRNEAASVDLGIPESGQTRGDHYGNHSGKIIIDLLKSRMSAGSYWKLPLALPSEYSSADRSNPESSYSYQQLGRE